ncbi:3-dehydroquinate synthase [Candidatus Protofrankia datiscae]|uniref:3-dehydroquinate synthase n=1 Tax=Candidatus Protofrankia datiscae TaxID=2716812 RepID=F8AZY4_9ACTN|nr:3-dehydroquinate synthase [Candidatus Protofrankia datiscae]
MTASSTAPVPAAPLASPGEPAAGDGVTRIEVAPTGERPYQVVVGAGLLGELAEQVAGRTRAAVIHPRALRATAEAVVTDLRETAKVEAHAVEVPDGEEAKQARVAGFCWDVLGQVGLTRDDVVIGLGGGATTDLAGFVAATWLRGVDLVQVPTTVLGMVDAAIGGKTGIDIDAGKNLVGAFHHPLAVFADLATLASLPVNERISGLAEVVKAGFIADPAILDLLEDDPSGLRHQRELIERSIRVKAAVVSADPREAGRREILNYGHTLGHAIEKVEGFSWRHGAAVSVGMVFAASLSRLALGLDEPTADRHRALLERIGLPTVYRADHWPALLDAMRLDKKSRGRRLRFVVLEGLGRPRILEDPDRALVVAAFSEVARELSDLPGGDER